MNSAEDDITTYDHLMLSDLQRWRDWCDGTIKNDVITMHAHRRVWRDLQDVIANNSDLPESYWWIVLRDTYSRTQAVAVRRHADRRRDSAGLYRLIHEIRLGAKELTRELWLDMWRQNPAIDDRLFEHAEHGWEKQYAGHTGNHLDPRIPKADLNLLTSESGRVTEWVNNNVAHVKHQLTPEGAKLDDDAEPASFATLTLGDIHDAIDVIGGLFRKYFNLLTASNMAQLDPLLPANWKAVFAQPWMTPADAAPFKPTEWVDGGTHED